MKALARIWSRYGHWILMVLLIVALTASAGCSTISAGSLINRTSLLQELAAVRGLERRNINDVMTEYCSLPANQLREWYGEKWAERYELNCGPPAKEAEP